MVTAITNSRQNSRPTHLWQTVMRITSEHSEIQEHVE